MPVIRTLAAILLAATLTLAPSAEAASKGEIKTQSTHVKELRKELKTLQKLTSKWEKAVSKGKDTGKIDADLNVIVKDELAWLRRQGQPTAKKKEGGKEANAWTARMRDAAVGVRDAKLTVEKRKHLTQLQNSLQTRLDRQQKKLDRMEN